MNDNRGDDSLPDAQQQLPPQLPPSPPDSTYDEPSEAFRQAIVVQAPPFLPIYVPSGMPPSPAFEQHRQFEPVNPKRPRFGVGQWKHLTSPPPHQQQLHLQKQTSAIHMAGVSTESTPSPSATHSSHLPSNPQTISSSDTASSPSHSPIPSYKEVMTMTTAKPESEECQHQRFRKGKYVSPVWKPNEMLWLARAWRIQHQGSGGSDSTETPSGSDELGLQSTRGKTRALKDREVAEFLNQHGVNRDAKTVGTKWDNMLGEFRKVYEWEKGGEREQLVGKSYFRLSPYERKLHRLPVSFDEEVFDELCQFMGPRMRSSQRGLPSIVASAEMDASGVRALPQPPPFKDDDPPHSAAAGRSGQLAVITGGDERFFTGSRRSGGILGFNPAFEVGMASTSSTPAKKEFRRLGKVRMTWEESVSLWTEEEGEHHRGRIRVGGSSFLNADELVYFDDSAIGCTLEVFEEGHLRGFSIDRFTAGQQIKVLGRRKTPSSQSSHGG